MAQQTIDLGTPGVGGDDIRTGGDKINDMMTELYQGSTTHYQCVATTGSDAADGKSWSTPKLTVAAALAALPQSGGKPNGLCDIWGGAFTESATPMVLGGGLMIRGRSTGVTGSGATRIELANGRNTHLFEVTNLGAQNHGLYLQGMNLGGNKANQSTSADIAIVKFAGGYGAGMDRIALGDAARWGIHIGGGYMNIQLSNITSSACGSTTQGGFLFCDNSQSGGVFSLDGAQIDQSGVYPIFIQYGTDGEGHMFSFRNIKMENQGDASLHTSAIRFSPRLTGTGNYVYILVENCFFYNNNASADQHVSAISEANEAGLAARWMIKQVEAGSQYQRAFWSEKTSRGSSGKSIRLFMEQSQTSALPYLEANGTWHFVHTATPEGAVTAPVGSTCLNRNGGATTTLYVKTSGTGNTGWTAK